MSAFFFLIAAMFAAINILRSPTGRAFVAIRDSEIAAQSLGVNLGLYKALSFAISGAFTGLAGALLAHYIGYLAPDIFNIFLSLTFFCLSLLVEWEVYMEQCLEQYSLASYRN